MLIASAKSQSVRGASHQSAFMSSRLTISHMFYLPYLPSTWRVLIDVPWSLMIRPMMTPLVHFLGMVWFQAYGGSQCYSREWVWNSRNKIVLEGCRKGSYEYGPTTGILCWIYDVLGELYMTRLSSLIDSKADSHTGDPWSYSTRGDPPILIYGISPHFTIEPLPSVAYPLFLH